MCFTKVQPVPISTIVMNSTAPFNLYRIDYRLYFNIYSRNDNLQMSYVEKNGPSLDVLASHFDKMEVYGMEHQRQWFQKYQYSHNVMNLENCVPETIEKSLSILSEGFILEFKLLALSQNEYPEQTRQEEQNRHHDVQRWQRHFTRRQIITSVPLFNVDLKKTVQGCFRIYKIH